MKTDERRASTQLALNAALSDYTLVAFTGISSVVGMGIGATSETHIPFHETVPVVGIPESTNPSSSGSAVKAAIGRGLSGGGFGGLWVGRSADQRTLYMRGSTTSDSSNVARSVTLYGVEAIA